MRNQRISWWIAILMVAGALYIISYFVWFTSTAEEEGTIMIILKSNSPQSDFWQTVRSGAEEAAKEKGIQFLVSGPLDDTDINNQLNALQDALVIKPLAVVIAPLNDKRVLAGITRLQNARIPVVVMDTPLPVNNAPSSVSSDHVQMGMQAGRMAAYQTNTSPYVAIIGDYQSSSIFKTREQGIKQVLGNMPHHRTVTYYSGESEQLAYVLTNKLLDEYPRPNALIVMNEPIAVGAARALKERHLDSIMFIAFDSSFYEIELLEEKTLDALIVQKPFNMGYLAVQKALTDPSVLDSQHSVTMIPSTVITPTTMYTPENQKLLFPFYEK